MKKVRVLAGIPRGHRCELACSPTSPHCVYPNGSHCPPAQATPRRDHRQLDSECPSRVPGPDAADPRTTSTDK